MNVLLDREVTIHRKAEPGDEGYVAPDSSYGTSRDVWVPLAPMPGSPPIGYRFQANLEDLQSSRSEGVQQGMVIAVTRSRVRIRYRPDVDSSMRVIRHGDGDSIWKIVTPPIEWGGRKQYLEFVIERTSSDG